MDCSEFVDASLRRWRLYMRSRANGKMIKKSGGTYSALAKYGRKDLELLCKRGANPNAVIWILDTFLWWWGGYSLEAAENSASELKELSRYRYWRRCGRILKKAEDFLSGLVSYRWVQTASYLTEDLERFPITTISRQARALRAGLRQFLQIIDELRLDKPGWELVQKSLERPPEIVRTGKARRGRRSGLRLHDWGICAATLSVYLRERTGRPHWTSIVRLLGFAGVKDFSEEIAPEGKWGLQGAKPTYVNTVRQRVLRLCGDPTIRSSIQNQARAVDWRFGLDGMLPDAEAYGRQQGPQL